MSQIAYVNGQFVDHAQATIAINDRGNQFADAVYEVIGIIDGVYKDKDMHFSRLQRSLSAMDIPLPLPIRALQKLVYQIIARNQLRFGSVYLQISRGVTQREHSYHGLRLRPSVMISAMPKSLAMISRLYQQGMLVRLKPDIRWQHCDIKTIGLLANCMAKSEAQAEGADDAWMVDAQGMITEGSSANAWIVDRAGVLRTRHLSAHILQGITRTHIAGLDLNISFAEEAFSIDELKNAREAFQTSATAIRPVTHVEGQAIGLGKVGVTTRQIQQAVLGDYSPHLPALLGIAA